MRRLFLSIVVLALSLIGVVIAPQRSAAAPLPAPYSGSAGGDVVAFDLDGPGGFDIANARLAVTESTVEGGATPTATASASNLSATVAGLGIAVDSVTQTAPPDNPTPDEDTIGGASAPGLLSFGLLDTSVQARSEAAVACTSSGGMLARSQVQTTGAIVNPTDVGTVVDTGDSETSGEVAIVPEPLSDPLNRAVISTAIGTISGSTFLDEAVGVTIDGDSTLQAIATGEGRADVTYTPGTVTVTVAGTSTTVARGTTEPFPVPGGQGQVDITVNELEDVTESADGQTATGAVAVVTAVVRVGPIDAPLATATVNLLPLRVEAVAPPGGIDCPPPPVLNTPADGSTTADTTPTFNGTAVPGAEVEILLDGNPIGTTTATPAGLFSFTPTTPLATGDHTAIARQTTAGDISQQSNANDFTIDTDAPTAPTLNEPAEGAVTRDTTPTFTGTAEPRAEVEIFVDDDRSIGTTTANGGGAFSFTPTTPLAAGPHEAYAVATDAAGNESPPSNTNAFRIDTAAPAAPVITSPEDGSTTLDSTFPIRGTAEPGSQVIIIRDGEEIGSTTADENGDFTFDLPSSLLPVGRYGFSARAVDVAGNSSAAADPVYVEVLGSAASLDDGFGESLADTGGPHGLGSLFALLAVLAGAGALTVVGLRRRGDQAGP